MLLEQLLAEIPCCILPLPTLYCVPLEDNFGTATLAINYTISNKMLDNENVLVYLCSIRNTLGTNVCTGHANEHCSNCIYLVADKALSLISEGSFQNHSRLRTPPLPLSHSHSPSQHHASSIGSLSRSNYTQCSNPSPAPTDSSAPNEGPTSAQDSGSAQDNWLLNSNVPLETRYVWGYDEVKWLMKQSNRIE